MSKTNDVVAIHINIDLEQVDRKSLPLIDIVAEEILHASDITRVGSKKWNEIARKENKLPYLERPRKARAKRS